MASLDPDDDKAQVQATPEIERLLRTLTNGHALDIVKNGVVLGRLSRVESHVPTSSAAPWEVALAAGATVPLEEWAMVPADMAKHFDHYRYGHTKEE